MKINSIRAGIGWGMLATSILTSILSRTLSEEDVRVFVPYLYACTGLILIGMSFEDKDTK